MMDWFPEDQLPSLIEGFLDSFEMKPFFDDQAEGAFLQRYEDQYQENDELCAKQADCELYGIEHSLKPRYIDILDDGYWGAGVSVTKDDHRTAQAQTPPSNVGRAQCSAASTGQQRFKREVIHHDSKPQIKKNSPPKGVGVSQERERISGLADMLQQPARHGPEVPARHQISATSSIGESSTIWYPGSIMTSQSKATKDSDANDDVLSIWEDSVPKLMSTQ